MTYYAMHSGIKIDLDDIDSIQFNLDDIAHHLTKICRYGGSLPLGVHYSVASHSINMALYALNELGDYDIARLALMHDATEAYLGDMVSGLKSKCRDYQLLEFEMWEELQNWYNLTSNLDLDARVAYLDKSILMDEVLGLMPSKFQLYRNSLPINYTSLGIKIVPDEDLHAVKSMFLVMCARLGIVDREEKENV